MLGLEPASSGIRTVLSYPLGHIKCKLPVLKPAYKNRANGFSKEV